MVIAVQTTNVITPVIYNMLVAYANMYYVK